MAGPRPGPATLFYRCALQRYEEAQVLRGNDKTTGAVYLAGYGVECVLKALILTSAPVSDLAQVMGSFRGRRAHDFDWLLQRYREQGGAGLPADVNRQFTYVNAWSTDLRCLPQAYKDREADQVLAATLVIIRWAEGRL
jgi:hypothetical protein